MNKGMKIIEENYWLQFFTNSLKFNINSSVLYTYITIG